MASPHRIIDPATASMFLQGIKETGYIDDGADLYKALTSKNEGGPTDEQRAWFEENRGKKVAVKDTAMRGVVRRLNEATTGLYPGSRYPIYVTITSGFDKVAIGGTFEYDTDQLEVIN